MNVSIKVKQNIGVGDHDNPRGKIDSSMNLPDIDVACGDNMLREIILQWNPEIGIFIEIIQLYFLSIPWMCCVHTSSSLAPPLSLAIKTKEPVT